MGSQMMTLTLANSVKIDDNIRIMPELNQIGAHLRAGVICAQRQSDERQQILSQADKINVVGAGGMLTAAYEQLRNAAENTEEHLLLQNAIRRFFKQSFIVRDEALVRKSGEELVVELTFAGYLPNDSVSRSQIKEISKLATAHYKAYEKLIADRSINLDRSSAWLLETLSVLAANVLVDHAGDHAFIDFAYEYFETAIPRDALQSTSADEYGAALYVAIQQALMKSDVATVRAGLLVRYGTSVESLEAFVEFNRKIDKMLRSTSVEELRRVVDRQGAPLRVIRHMMETQDDFPALLQKREAFLDEFERQVNREYSSMMARINRAIMRSVVFLVITKFLIGIAIEVPYDLWAHGQIEWLVLMINLFFPPIYMVLLRLTLNVPGYANTEALIKRVDQMLYGGDNTVLMRRQLAGRTYSSMFSIMYGVMSLAVFALATWLLTLIGFSPVHIIIFFVFFSAASFLGFRLSRLIRDLEIVRSASNGFTFVRDTLYLPFVVAGRWMSDKYAQVNIVSMVLDMLIELPLKTILRKIRQWAAFIDDRKDSIS